MTNTFDVIDEKFESSKNALHSYVTGYVLSLLFTYIPYLMVTRHLFGKDSTIFGIAVFAVIQLCVQVYFFLHLPARVRPFWNFFVLMFTILIISFLVVGSLWIMHHLNMNMMGVSPFHSNEGYVPQ